MYDKSILQKICDYVPALQEPYNKPFVFDGYEYYLNNHFGIRIPSQDENNINNGVMLMILRDGFGSQKINDGMNITAYDYAEMMKEFQVCTECDPGKKDSVFAECYECRGCGEVVFENDFNSYECDCKSCNGTGHKRIRKCKYARHECPKCHGSGVWSEKTMALPIGDHFIDSIIVGFLISIFKEINVYDPHDDRHIFFNANNGTVEGTIGILNIGISDIENDCYKKVNQKIRKTRIN